MTWWLIVLSIASSFFLLVMLSISLNGMITSPKQSDRSNFFTTLMMHAVILATLLFLIYRLVWVV